MKKPNYQQSFYTSPMFFMPAMFGVVVVFGIFSFAKNTFQSEIEHSIIFGSTNLCEQKAYIDLASQHSLSYTLEHDYGFPGVKIVGNKATIQTIREQYTQNHKADLLTFRGASKQGMHENTNMQCHLSDVKYHVNNVNPKLIPYIPNNVDYVSYSPTADKAVYCSYYFVDDKNHENYLKKGSDCSFIQLAKNVYGNDELESYDISDMERANLEQIRTFYRSNQLSQSLYGVYSYVTNWEDSPTHYFGFNLSTPFNGNRWGGYGEY